MILVFLSPLKYFVLLLRSDLKTATENQHIKLCLLISFGLPDSALDTTDPVSEGRLSCTAPLKPLV